MQMALREGRLTLMLALPIIAGQLSQMLMGLIDTVMIGKLGTDELATVAFVSVLFNMPFVFGIGLFASISVLVSHQHGSAKNHDRLAEILRNGLLCAVGLGVLLAALMFSSLLFLDKLKQPEAVVELTPTYLFWIALSLVPIVPAFTIKSYIEARNHPWLVLWVMLLGVVANFVLNYILIFGNFGFPHLGLAGAGIATLLARFISLAGLLILLHKSKHLNTCLPTRWLKPLDFGICREVLKMAMPISGQLLMEFGSFSVVALLIGRFGSVALAAHQIAMSCITVTFMIPLGLAMAVTIRVGHTLSTGQRTQCGRLILSAHAMSLIVMTVCALLFVSCGEVISRVFSQDLEVIALAGSLFVIVALFQIFDGTQVISMSALRGLKDVNVPTGLLFVSFWVTGIPLGIWLAFSQGWQARGLWTGLACGLALAAIILSLRLKQQFNKVPQEA